MKTKHEHQQIPAPDHAAAIGLQAIAFILSTEALQDRFLGMTGLSEGEIRQRLEDADFLLAGLDFLMGFEPDLLAFAAAADLAPEDVVGVWHALGGGTGQEW